MKRSLLELKSVDVELGGRLVLRDISWRLMPGQHWVVLGRNGSGKSTFLRLVRGELWPVAGGGGQRVYRLDGQTQTTAVGVKETFALVSPEQQNRYLYQEWSLKVGAVIESGVGGGDYVYERLTPAQLDRVQAVSRLLRVEHLVSRHVQELSTGELRRVLIARALAGQPRVLVCDEMADGLDVDSRAALLTALDSVARRGTQLLLSTHRADEIPPAITHRMVLEEGAIIEQGKILRNAGRREFDRCFAESVGGTPPSDATAPVRKPSRADAGEVLIQIRNAEVYLGFAPTLQDINLEIRRGQHWAVLGPNGSGKSTLLKLIAGDVHPAVGGQVRRFAFTAKNTIWEVRARLGHVSPELQASYREPISGADVVASGFFSSIGLVRKPSTAQQRRVREVIALLGLEPLAQKNFMEMSYGEARRILLARALVKKPALILFDEPFDGLDVVSRQEMSGAIARAAETGATLVIVTHHAEDLPGCITHVARLSGGRLEYCGPLGGA